MKTANLEQLLEGFRGVADNRKIMLGAEYVPRGDKVSESYEEKIAKETRAETAYYVPENKTYWASGISRFPMTIDAPDESFRLRKMGVCFDHNGIVITLHVFPDTKFISIDRPRDQITNYIKDSGWQWEQGTEK